jgi:GAF domain-containing protein
MIHASNGTVPADTKPERYAQLAEQAEAVLADEPSLIARMATVAALLADSFEHYLWTGFYLVDPERPDELVIGPYQGTLGCLRIPFGRGVCGAAARTRRTQVVADVHAFPGHIACDSRSASEIVVPVVDREGRLIGVFDVDSERPAAFDEADRQGLETLLRRIFAG